ncbi:MAG: rubredoxin [Desulfurobacterium sp.]|nr:MAG: rubredoxin [Desulfurobacterium sp.]
MEELEHKLWRCTVCGYIYDVDEGDPENNIPPGTPFEVLPYDWVCPVCGATKDKFEPADD